MLGEWLRHAHLIKLFNCSNKCFTLLHRDRSQHYGKFGTTLFYILDDVVSCVTHESREQIDIYHHICIRLLPRKDDIVPFYSCACEEKKSIKINLKREKKRNLPRCISLRHWLWLCSFQFTMTNTISNTSIVCAIHI